MSGKDIRWDMGSSSNGVGSLLEIEIGTGVELELGLDGLGEWIGVAAEGIGVGGRGPSERVGGEEEEDLIRIFINENGLSF